MIETDARTYTMDEMINWLRTAQTEIRPWATGEAKFGPTEDKEIRKAIADILRCLQ